MDLTVLTYNTFLTVPVPLRFNGQKERSLQIPQAISLFNESLTNKIDVIIATELIAPSHRERVLSQLRQRGWFYHTKPLSKNPFFDTLKLVSGGIVIISRYPILQEDAYIFEDACEGYDCTACKGCLYARINKNGHIFNVFGTHYQAWDTPTAQELRMRQAKDCQRFIARLDIPKTEPVIFGGDLNLDMYTCQAELKEVLDLIQMVPADRDRNSYQFTSDPSTNELMGSDEDSIYATLNHPKGCYNEYVATGVCICCPQQWLDYICYSTQHLQPSQSNMKVVKMKSREPYKIQFNITTEKWINDLSDHYPVLGEFRFEVTTPSEAVGHKVAKYPKQRTFCSLWQGIFIALLIIALIVAFLLGIIFIPWV